MQKIQFEEPEEEPESDSTVQPLAEGLKGTTEPANGDAKKLAEKSGEATPPPPKEEPAKTEAEDEKPKTPEVVASVDKNVKENREISGNEADKGVPNTNAGAKQPVQTGEASAETKRPVVTEKKPKPMVSPRARRERRSKRRSQAS